VYEEADVKKHQIAEPFSVDLSLQLSAQYREYLWLVRRVKLPSGIHFLVRRHERGEDSNVMIGRRANRWIRGMRVKVAPLDAHFVGRVRTTLFGEAVAWSRRSIAC
jgi:hypothetical protein